MAKPGRRAYLLISVFAFLLVLLPFLFWYGTWFGRKLSDQDIDAYLNDLSKPRRVQHALVQIGERLRSGDRSVARWYPKVTELAGSRVLELRQTAGWIMGSDRGYEPFRASLAALISDPEPMVRRNAALALSNFRDDRALEEVRAMLRSSELISRDAGTIRYRLRIGEYVNPGTLVARVGDTEVRAVLPGELQELRKAEGAEVKAGDVIADLSADKDHIWEALRALLLIGSADDLETVRRFARGTPGMPERIQRQAALTATEIESRVRGPVNPR